MADGPRSAASTHWRHSPARTEEPNACDGPFGPRTRTGKEQKIATCCREFEPKLAQYSRIRREFGIVVLHSQSGGSIQKTAVTLAAQPLRLSTYPFALLVNRYDLPIFPTRDHVLRALAAIGCRHLQ